MWHHRKAPVVCFFICFLFIIAQAGFYPHRYYVERTKKNLNYGWKFSQDDPGNPLPGNPYQTGYSDASWQTVNIPHSASYDPPTKVDEDASFKGTCWYRLRFQVPAPAVARHRSKMFLEFEGAMQTADVWLNGLAVGAHYNSGYTGFSLDITNRVLLSGDNVLAVRLDNNYRTNIPPGNPGNVWGPDYYLFSGLYRNVWLVCTDSCYIPFYGQQISVPQGPYPAGASVRIKTVVRNDYTAAKNITLRYILAYDERDRNAGFLIDSITQAVNAATSAVFEKTVGPIQNPRLWSLADPYLYRVFTQVFVDGVIADDYVERFGVRWYTWAGTENFKLNGQSVYLKGNSLHQMFPWIQNAVPPSRAFKDIKLAQDMGVNLVRCAHYPRNPAYYDACDELGMLLFVEIPTWGTSKPESFYPEEFWTRLDSCVQEMILVGYNHPSIIAWGLFNEPGENFPNRITTLNNSAHRLDSTRLTYMAVNSGGLDMSKIPDICGINYLTTSQITVTPMPTRLVNTEYHVGWSGDYAYRGDPNDVPTLIAAHFWNDWITQVVNDPLLAGGTAWCHADYNSPMNYIPMGVVDCYRIPKSTYYLYRENWRGIQNDNPVTGATPAKVLLEADTNQIVADSVDCVIIYASIRSAGDTCVHTGYNTTSTTNITFTITGPADRFGPQTVKVNGGKCALLIKSRNTTGQIRIIATSTGLTPDTLYLNSVAQDNSPLQFISPVITRPYIPVNKNIAFKQNGGTLRLVFPVKDDMASDIALVNIRGQKMSCPVTVCGAVMIIDTKKLSAGSYYLSISGKTRKNQIVKKVLIAQ